MSYRRTVLEQHPPDPAAAFHSEDVQLSYRVRQTHRLVITPQARLRHEEVADGRLSGAPLVERELRSRWDRVCEGTGAYSRRAFWVSAWGQWLRYGIPALITRRPERRAIATGTGRGIRAIRRARSSAR